MRFFIPMMGPDNAEAIYQGIRSFMTDNWRHRLSDRRIHQIKGPSGEISVGKQYGPERETVYAIFETPDKYLVCTPRHGVSDGAPLVVKRKEVSEVVDFESLIAPGSSSV